VLLLAVLACCLPDGGSLLGMSIELYLYALGCLFYLDFCWPACSAIGYLTGVACVVTIARCGRCGGGKGPFHNAPEKAVCVTAQKLESNSGSVTEEKGLFAGVAER
jgi:hypothetical protein